METITYGSEGGGKCKRSRPTLLFFMVMPALIGGFGKIHMNTKRYFSTKSESNVKESNVKELCRV